MPNYLKLLIITGLTCLSANFMFALSPLELREKADILREQGKSLEAINTYNHAILQYQEQKDYSNMIDALTGRLLCWKHLFYKTQDPIYAIQVKTSAQAMIEIANLHKLSERAHLMYFLQATASILLKDYASAEMEYAKAIALFPTENSEKGDWMGHLGEVMYKNDKKIDGMAMMLAGIEKIEQHTAQLDDFLRNVWLSGAYIRLAKLLTVDDAKKSQLFLLKAKEIIDSDDRLVIRKQQLEAFLEASAHGS